MARTAKKETALTAEERMAQALVPEAEQPYQVPENWCWTRLAYLIATSKEKTEDFSDPSVKYVGLENMEKDSGIVSYDSADGIKSLKNVFSKGQILYGKLRPYLNKHDVATFDGVCSTDILVFDVKETATNKYVNYFFNPFSHQLSYHNRRCRCTNSTSFSIKSYIFYNTIFYLHHKIKIIYTALTISINFQITIIIN